MKPSWTSGRRWTRAVAIRTPPPKQARADVIDLEMLETPSPFEAHFIFLEMKIGTIPIIMGRTPKTTMDTTFATSAGSIYAVVTISCAEQNKTIESTGLDLFRWCTGPFPYTATRVRRTSLSSIGTKTQGRRYLRGSRKDRIFTLDGWSGLDHEMIRCQQKWKWKKTA